VRINSTCTNRQDCGLNAHCNRVCTCDKGLKSFNGFDCCELNPTIHFLTIYLSVNFIFRQSDDRHKPFQVRARLRRPIESERWIRQRYVLVEEHIWPASIYLFQVNLEHHSQSLFAIQLYSSKHLSSCSPPMVRFCSARICSSDSAERSHLRRAHWRSELSSTQPENRHQFE